MENYKAFRTQTEILMERRTTAISQQFHSPLMLAQQEMELLKKKVQYNVVFYMLMIHTLSYTTTTSVIPFLIVHLVTFWTAAAYSAVAVCIFLLEFFYFYWYWLVSCIFRSNDEMKSYED